MLTGQVWELSEGNDLFSGNRPGGSGPLSKDWLQETQNYGSFFDAAGE